MSREKARAILALWDAVIALRREIGHHSIMARHDAIRMEYATGCALLDSFGIIVENAL